MQPGRRRWYFGLSAPTVQPRMYIAGSDRGLVACLYAGACVFYLLAEPVFMCQCLGGVTLHVVTHELPQQLATVALLQCCNGVERFF